jgi:opacity protein-like surface antigen
MSHLAFFPNFLTRGDKGMGHECRNHTGPTFYQSRKNRMRKWICLVVPVIAFVGMTDAARGQQGGYWRSSEPATTTVAPATGESLTLALPAAPSRAGRYELFGEAGYVFGDNTTGTDGLNHPWTFDVKPNVAGGGGLGYNIGRHFNLNFDITTGPARITETVNHSRPFSSSDTWMTRGMANIEWYPLGGPITPLVTAGVGALNTAGNLSGIERSETHVAYGVGAGIRWDIDDHWFTKVIYRATWSQYDFTDNALLFQSIFVSVGWKF